MTIPTGYETIARFKGGEVLASARRVIVLGTPIGGEDENGDSMHNCDAMGCGQSHVVAIVDRPAPTPAADPLAAVRAALDVASKATPIEWLWSNERKCVDATQLGTDGAVYDRYSFGPVGVDDLWDEDDAATWAKDASAIVALRNATPAIAELCAEVERLRRHYNAAGPEHNLLALLDLYHEREQAAIAKLAEAKRLGLEAHDIASSAVQVIDDEGIDDDNESPRVKRDLRRIAAALEAL